MINGKQVEERWCKDFFHQCGYVMLIALKRKCIANGIKTAAIFRWRFRAFTLNQCDCQSNYTCLLCVRFINCSYSVKYSINETTHIQYTNKMLAQHWIGRISRKKPKWYESRYKYVYFIVLAVGWCILYFIHMKSNIKNSTNISNGCKIQMKQNVAFVSAMNLLYAPK